MAGTNSDAANAQNSVVLHEEELVVGAEPVVVGLVRARKTVASDEVEDVVARGVEHADVERMSPLEGDSGQIETLPDGSVSIPVLEEELVISKRVVVRERIVIRKETVIEHERVTAELRREQMDVELAEE